MRMALPLRDCRTQHFARDTEIRGTPAFFREQRATAVRGVSPAAIGAAPRLDIPGFLPVAVLNYIRN